MNWYKFKEDGTLVREEVIAGVVPDGWNLLNLHSFLMTVHGSHEPKLDYGESIGDKHNKDQPLVKLGFLDCRDERVPLNPKEVIFRLSDTSFGWGRYFGHKPGKLAGYSLESGKLLIVCSLVPVDGIEAYTWHIEQDKFDISYTELHSFYREVGDLCGLLLKKDNYPALFM